MLEGKITIVAPDLTEAINNLAAAISGKILQAQNIPASQSGTPMSVPAPTPAASVQPATTQFQTPAVPVQPATPIAAVPLASAPQFTVDQIMTAGATLMDAGKVDELLNLLHAFGVQAVMELKPEQLGAFATEMRKLGAAI